MCLLSLSAAVTRQPVEFSRFGPRSQAEVDRLAQKELAVVGRCAWLNRKLTVWTLELTVLWVLATWGLEATVVVIAAAETVVAITKTAEARVAAVATHVLANLNTNGEGCSECYDAADNCCGQLAALSLQPVLLWCALDYVW
jgi:hypothetical protein